MQHFKGTEHIVIGTAGHVDHGKTTLIKALTGRDTDTIKEERQRGISIDLGFTYFDLPDGRRAGIVDVPGHEKFLGNMLAGVCGMDIVLLVIALDEGVKPQTIEHMEILMQLGVRQGIIVLTKLDRVDEEWAELIEEEIAEETEGTLFSEWPRIRVSSLCGDGIELLKKEIQRQARGKERKQTEDTAFRMPIDRVLSIDGRGTVIAGTVLEGEIQRGNEIELYPTEKCVRIRSIQTHGEGTERVEAGQRAALLVAGIKKDEVKRGDVAAAVGTMRLTERVDVRLNLSRHTERILKNRMRVHFHIGSDQVLCRVILLGCDTLKAGMSCYAQLLLEEKIAVKKGDRFIVRFYSPLETIGGGMILDACAKKHRRMDIGVQEDLKQLEEDKTEQLIYKKICMAKEAPVSRETLKEIVGRESREAGKILESIEKSNREFLTLCGKKKVFFTCRKNMRFWMQQLDNVFINERNVHPYRKWISGDILKKKAFPQWGDCAFIAFVDYLVQAEMLYKKQETYAHPKVPVMQDWKFERMSTLLLEQLTDARFQFLDCRELRPKEISEEDYQDILDVLTEEKKMIRISDIFYTTAELEQEAIARVRAYFQEREILTYTALRDLLETTRRSIRPLIAYLDTKKITEPCGKETERRKH